MSKIAIVGSRTFSNYILFSKALKETIQFEEIDEFVSGGAKGVDSLIKVYAQSINISIKEFIPNWSEGKSAGFNRNTKIVQYCDKLIAFWDNKSRGTKDSINKAIANNKLWKIIDINELKEE